MTIIGTNKFNKMNMKRTFLYAMSVLMICSFASCSSEDVFEDFETPPNPQQANTCKLVLNVSKPYYDEEASTRSSTRSVSAWEEGDKIYLTFSTEAGNTYGDAIYTNGSWSVNYYGTLTEGTSSKCTAVYFDNATDEGSTVVLVDQHTGIYEDTSALYAYSDGTLSVTAQLTPKTGRMRFAGNEKDSITVYGISHYTSYDASTCKFSTTDVAIKEGVATDYTEYVYGFFTDSVQPRLNIITSNSGFYRLLPTSIYKKGESGYLTIPSETSHIGWHNTLNLKVNDVEFKMIPVTGYTGGFFLLAETETTEQLYNAIINNTFSDSQKPFIGTYNSSFITKINLITELDFYLPELGEWQFAFIGGEKTLGYKYSGSNVVSDVAWYSGNSGGEVHEVKQLQPNELGFYDMSGNVAEYTGGRWYGGSYGFGEGFCFHYEYITNSYSSYYKNIGFRIALKP
jgi:hypothetical protein